MESFCKGNPKGTMNYFKSFNYIVADEYHYLLTDAAINKYIDLSYVTLNELTKYRPVIFMSEQIKKTGERIRRRVCR